MTSVFYDEYNYYDDSSISEYNRLYQPNFTRTRQTFRGSRDSEKVNLEIQQLFYDLYSIYAKLKESSDDQADFYSFIHGGFYQALVDPWPSHTDTIYRYSFIQGNLDTLTIDDFYTILCDLSVTEKRLTSILSFYKNLVSDTGN